MQNRQSPNQIEPDVRPIDRVLDGIAALCQVLTNIALVVLTVIFGWLVFGRYVLNATPTWVEQAALLLVMLIAFIGAAVGVHENTHLSVSLFRTLVPPRVRVGLVVLSDILMAGFGFSMLWFGAQLTAFKWASKIPLLQLPEGLRSLPLTVGGGLIFLFSIGHLMRRYQGRDLRSDAIE